MPKRIVQGDIHFADIVLIYSQITYMLLLSGFIFGVIDCIKDKNIKVLLPLFLIVFFGSTMTLITVGGARYHIPYLPIFMLFTASFISNSFLKDKKKKQTIVA
jgi:hypothetical protein